MQKEILTKEILKCELKNRFYKDIKEELLHLPIMLFCIILLVLGDFMFIKFLHLDKSVFDIVSHIFYVFFIIAFLADISIAVIGIYNANKFNYLIVSDKLVNKKYRFSSSHRGYNPPALIFARCGKFFIKDGEHYTNCKTFTMSADGVYNSSVIGDEFYVVTVKFLKYNNILAYNKKMFEYEYE